MPIDSKNFDKNVGKAAGDVANRKLSISEIVMRDLRKDAPDYENNIRSKFPGYNLVISFPTRPDMSLTFPAFIKKVSDKIQPSYEPKKVYGRMDAIPIYQGTTRTIDFELSLPSNGLAHSIEISKKLNDLTKNLYPTYQRNGYTDIVSSPPLARVFFSSFISNGYVRMANGLDISLLGYFSGGITINHDLEGGVFAKDEGFDAYAKFYNLSFSFTVLHEFTPGFVDFESNSHPLKFLQEAK